MRDLIFKIRMNRDPFKIYLISNNKNIVHIANIKFQNEKYSDIDILNINNSSVYNFNNQICNYIICDNIYDCTNKPCVIISDDIIGVLVDRIRWRRATAYLWIQKSNKNYRYLCYMSDEIKHCAECFGTNVNHVIENQLYKIKDRFSKSKFAETYIKDYPELQETITSMNDINNVNEHFGI